MDGGCGILIGGSADDARSRLKSEVHHKPVRGIARRKPRDSNRKPKEPALDEIPGRTTAG
jgi:hypothetical protein